MTTGGAGLIVGGEPGDTAEGNEPDQGIVEKMIEINELPYSVGDFNMRMMEEDGALNHRLVSREGGGYALKNVNGDTLSVIPTTDERMAAWCAWYYLLGMERGTHVGQTKWLDKAKQVKDNLRGRVLEGWAPSSRPS